MLQKKKNISIRSTQSHFYRNYGDHYYMYINGQANLRVIENIRVRAKTKRTRCK